MISPFVTNVLMKIALDEAELHFHHRRLLPNATNDEQRTAIQRNAVAHGQVASFFTKLAEARLIQHSKQGDL